MPINVILVLYGRIGTWYFSPYCVSYEMLPLGMLVSHYPFFEKEKENKNFRNIENKCCFTLSIG